MIRLLLNSYSYDETLVLYSVLTRARQFLSENSKPAKDLDEALAYLTGYSDAALAKEGKKCQHV